MTAMAPFLLATGQKICFDQAGGEIACAGSGQDGEFVNGATCPDDSRFEIRDFEVFDHLTGLSWLRDAAVAGFPLSWRESLDFIETMNRDTTAGHDDWRLPNRRELRSLVSHGTARPALPEGHPFINVVQSWYWTSTTAAINYAYAWYINMEGARMFYGAKNQYFMLWPVRGQGSRLLPVTGQKLCHDESGAEVACAGSGHDGESQSGSPWPSPRFEFVSGDVRDNLTGLIWRRGADLTGEPVSWSEALAAVAALNSGQGEELNWRLPNINELESLIDCSSASPALPADHRFDDVREAYWSSTTSFFESDWSWALYLEKGACGVGRKNGRYFSAWPVRDSSIS
jgi:hypothetical protein